MEIYDPTNLIKELESKYIFRYIKGNYSPTLVILMSHNHSEDDECYLRSLKKVAQEYRVNVNVRQCENDLIAAQEIQILKSDSNITGVLFLGKFDNLMSLASQLPMRLDLDCANYGSLGHMIFSNDESSFRLGPCTSIACYEIIKDILGTNNFAGLKMGIIGRSLRVGLPLAEILVQRDATTTVYHSKSNVKFFSNYDVVVSAVGRPHIWNHHSFHNNSIIIDVGINELNGKICGDIDYEFLDSQDGVLVPSPGGVGKVTTTVLFCKLFINFGLANGELIQ